MLTNTNNDSHSILFSIAVEVVELAHAQKYILGWHGCIPMAAEGKVELCIVV